MNKDAILFIKKKIQKELINELYNKDLIDFESSHNISKKLDEDIGKLPIIKKENQKTDNITIDIPL